MTVGLETREQRLAELETLATGLCEDAEIRLELWEGNRWRWDPLQRTIYVPATDLDKDSGLNWCAGIISREVGHYFLSKHHLFWLDFPSWVAGKALLTVLDNARVERWIRERYPGTQPWMALSHTPASAIDPEGPLFLQFCQAASFEHAWPDDVNLERLHPAVREALDATREARRELIDYIPPLNLEAPEDPEIDEIYRNEVGPALFRLRMLPSAWERTVQVLAYLAFEIVQAEIAPHVEPLLDHDLELLQQYLNQERERMEAARRGLSPEDAERMVNEAMAAGRLRPMSEAERRSMRWGSRFSAQRAYDAMLRGMPVSRRLIEPMEVSRSLWDRLPRMRPLNFDWNPPTDYDTSYQKVADSITELTQRLDDILRPQRRMGAKSGYPSGRRVDLRKLMTFDADPRRYNQLWVRNTIPDRRNVAVMLLVDLSGSMAGDKVETALAGTILLAETLHRLNVEFAVDGFQDILIPFRDFNEPFTDAVRDRMATMVQEASGNRDGGNNCPAYNDDGPCVRESAEKLLDFPATTRIMVVISDGLPAGRRSNNQDLHDAIRDIKENEAMYLVGLGLGSGTGHVTDFYPDSVANIPPHRFTEEIADLIEQIVLF